MKTVAIVTVALVMICVSQACNIPPSYWCSSVEVAKQCGVLDQCMPYLAPKADAPPVNFTLYYESLCPDCRNFFANQLHKTYMELGPSVMNLTLVPYGNARERKVSDMWEFDCQHGKQECIGNVIESCAIVLLSNISVYFPFIDCMEASHSGSWDQTVKQCGQQFGINTDPIMVCANGKSGNDIEHKMAQKTDALSPPHRYVPWVTLNGVHTENINNKAVSNLLELICQTYQGATPKACSHLQDKLTHRSMRH